MTAGQLAGRPSRYRLATTSARRKVRLGLFESDPDTLFLAPDDAAGQFIALGDQVEPHRDSNRACHVERRAGGRDITDRAIDGPAIEFDGSAFQYTLSGRNPVLVVHWMAMSPQNQPTQPLV